MKTRNSAAFPAMAGLLCFLSACGVSAQNPGEPRGKIVLDSRSPAAATSGSILELKGARFGLAPGTVSIGNMSADIVAWDEDRVLVQVPAADAQVCATVQVQRPDGESSDALPFSYGDHDVWVPNSEVPTPRSQHTAAWTGREMIIWGGEGNTGSRYNPATDSWVAMSTAGAPPAPLFRDQYVAVWTGDELFVRVARQDYADTERYTQRSYGARYRPGTDSWIPVADEPRIPPVQGQAAVWTGKEVIVWGGRPQDACGMSACDTIGGKYQPATDTWAPMSTGIENAHTAEEKAAAAHQGRWNHSAVWTGKQMIIWGGQFNHQTISTGAAYNPDSDTWSYLPVAGAPAPRESHVAVWTGSEMIIWGGRTDRSIYHDGAAWNPSTRTWRTLSAEGAPTGGLGVAFVWGDGKLFVSGGAPTLYDPADDTWKSLDAKAVLPPASMATAIWSGEEFIVWGGTPGDAPSAAGARYNPKNGTWVPVAGDVTPGRAAASTYWTGREVLIWGGFDLYPAGVRNTPSAGGRYDPVANRWLPTATPDGLRGRMQQVEAWTGDKLIVWGGISLQPGESAPTYPAGVAMYAPATDSWAFVHASGEPSPRAGAAAVWTGEEFVVWGGNSSRNVPLSDGSAFRPASGLWRPLTATGAPGARTNASAVFDGKEMLVYGGGYFDAGLNPMPVS